MTTRTPHHASPTPRRRSSSRRSPETRTTFRLNLSTDFLRGLLFCFAVCQLIILLRAYPWHLDNTAHVDALHLIAPIISTLLHFGTACALLFAPRDYARLVTVFFGIVLGIQLISAFLWNLMLPVHSPSPFRALLFSQLVIGAIVLTLAFTLAFLFSSHSMRLSSASPSPASPKPIDPTPRDHLSAAGLPDSPPSANPPTPS